MTWLSSIIKMHRRSRCMTWWTMCRRSWLVTVKEEAMTMAKHYEKMAKWMNGKIIQKWPSNWSWRGKERSCRKCMPDPLDILLRWMQDHQQHTHLRLASPMCPHLPCQLLLPRHINPLPPPSGHANPMYCANYPTWILTVLQAVILGGELRTCICNSTGNSPLPFSQVNSCN